MIDVSIDRALVTGNWPAESESGSEGWGGSFIAHAGVHLCLANTQKIARVVPADLGRTTVRQMSISQFIHHTSVDLLVDLHLLHA